MSAAEKYDKYANFSDNTHKDRMASMYPMKGSASASALAPSAQCSGWDKYYFFSVPADCSCISRTARLGRMRPASDGPCTFQMEAFSKERIAKERPRIEAKSGGTCYSESFSQIERNAIATAGPVTFPEPQIFNTRGGSLGKTLARAGSDSFLKPDTSKTCEAEDEISNQPKLRRMGPFWPPKEKKMPDPVETRAKLFGGAHRGFQENYSQDRRAPRSTHYAVFHAH